MSRIPRSLILFAAALPVLAFSQSNQYASNEVLVKFRSGGVPLVTKLAVGGTTIETLKHINVERIRLNGMPAQNALKVFRQDRNVVYAELNPKRTLDYVPNDPRLSEQYGIDQVHAKQAWDISTGSASTIICVIDTGVRLDHEEFAGKIAAGCYDWSDGDNDVSDNTGSGHGTHTSGIAVAGTDNGKGIASAAFNGKLLHMKIFPNAFATTSASAIMDAADKGARVISMSYGSYAPSQAEEDAVNYAWNKGVILFGSAGNDNIDASSHYPSAYANVISIGATNNLDQKAGFSNYGPKVDLAAPGEDILSTFFNSPTDYVFESGTSMACPFAASVAGLLIGYNPGITNTQLRNILYSTADNVGTWVVNGRINAYKAIQQVSQPVPYVSTPISAQVAVIDRQNEGIQQGSYATPSLAGSTLREVDGSVFTVSSVIRPRLGTTAGVDTFVQLNVPTSDLLSANITMTARSFDRSSCLVFLYNYTTGNWDQFGSTSMSSTNKTVTWTIPLSSLSKYMNGSNMFRIMARNVLPQRLASLANYRLVVDQLNITGNYKVSP